MTTGNLPLILNPKKLAERNVEYSGRLAGKLFERFNNDELGELSPVDVKLHFFTDEQGFRVIKGSAKTSVALTCQRCLQIVDKPIKTSWLLAVVKTEEHVEKLPTAYEPYFQLDAKMPLEAMVEEELLLALPSIAVHDECEPIEFTQEELVVEEKPNPFAVLESLKK